MRELRRRLGPWALLLIPIWMGWEVIDAWGNIVFVTEGGRWDWMPETSTLTPVWRVLVLLAAVVIVVSYGYEWYVSRHPVPERRVHDVPPQSRTMTGGELTDRSYLELDSTADDLITGTKFSGDAYVKGKHRPPVHRAKKGSTPKKRKRA